MRNAGLDPPPVRPICHYDVYNSATEVMSCLSHVYNKNSVNIHLFSAKHISMHGHIGLTATIIGLFHCDWYYIIDLILSQKCSINSSLPRFSESHFELTHNVVLIRDRSNKIYVRRDVHFTVDSRLHVRSEEVGGRIS